MSIEAGVALAVAGATLISACVSIGVVLGIQRAKVDRLSKDMDSAFQMIRNLQQRKKE